jgi:hypothetical protein
MLASMDRFASAVPTGGPCATRSASRTLELHSLRVAVTLGSMLAALAIALGSLADPAADGSEQRPGSGLVARWVMMQ